MFLEGAFLITHIFTPFPGANVNAAKLHETALHHAAKVKNSSLIELLVEFGGNVYARDNMNKKPIDYTSLGSPSYCCLEFYESKFVNVHIQHDKNQIMLLLFFLSYLDTPLSLQQLSRVALRRTLGTRARNIVSKLDLPNRIIRFLCYTPPQVIEI